MLCKKLTILYFVGIATDLLDILIVCILRPYTKIYRQYICICVVPIYSCRVFGEPKYTKKKNQNILKIDCSGVCVHIFVSEL